MNTFIIRIKTNDNKYYERRIVCNTFIEAFNTVISLTGFPGEILKIISITLVEQ